MKKDAKEKIIKNGKYILICAAALGFISGGIIGIVRKPKESTIKTLNKITSHYQKWIAKQNSKPNF